MRKKKIIALALLFVMIVSAAVPFIYKNEAYAAGRMIISLNPETDIEVGQEFAVYLTARNENNENTTASMKLTFEPSLIEYISSNASDAACNNNVITATGKSVKFTFKAIAPGTVSLIARATADGADLESAGIRVTITGTANNDDNGDDDNGGDDNGGDDNGGDDSGDDSGEVEEPDEPVVIDVKETTEYKQLQENYNKLYDTYNRAKNDKRRFFLMTIIFGAVSFIFFIIIIVLLIKRRTSDDYDDYDGYDEPKGGNNNNDKPDKKAKKQEALEAAERDRLREEAIARDLKEREEKMRMTATREEAEARKSIGEVVAREVKKNRENDDYLERTASKSEQADVDIAKQVSKIIAMRTSKLASPDQVEGLVKEDISPTPAKIKDKKKAFDEDDLFLMDIDDL
ncbi:MAG: hypothetical protein IJK13_02500 [Lachnospiraceae bacterium]|nr:hypothetical protein [Lachnospiraceae bacterium]